MNKKPIKFLPQSSSALLNSKYIALKITLCLIIFAMSITFFPHVKVKAYTPPDALRVGIIYNSVSSNPITFSAPGGVTIYDSTGAQTYQTNNSVNITMQKSALGGVDAVIDGSIVASGVTDLTFTPNSNFLALSGISYRGSFIVNRLSTDGFNVINKVNINDYVQGVVAKEIGASSPTEALKAQAVCARNYGAAHLNKHSKYGFDVCNTTDCQVYGGINTETPAIIDAVQATSNVYALYNGALADLVFSSSTGGYTEDAQYVWGGDVPYLKPVDSLYEDKNKSYYNWTYEITPAEATTKLSKYGLGNITDIQIIAATPRNVTTQLKVIGDAGEKVFKLEACRTLFGTGLKSQAYTLTKEGGTTTTPSQIMAIDKDYETQAVPSNPSIITSNGTQPLTESVIAVITKDGTQSIPGVSTPTTSGVTKFVFNGRGFGHLVGLSQEGAIGMAKAGFSYQDILKHFYTGITL